MHSAKALAFLALNCGGPNWEGAGRNPETLSAYGYARVSTRGQQEERQLVALREFGVKAEYIVVERWGHAAGLGRRGP